MVKKFMLELNAVSRDFVVQRSFFGAPTKLVHAVKDVSFKIPAGETTVLVGESGSGKSTLGRCIALLDKATAGEIKVDNFVVNDLKKSEKMLFRRTVQTIFQDPYSSLNPRRSVGDAIMDGMQIHKLYDDEQAVFEMEQLLEKVGLKKSYADRFPHQFSGGQRQRIAIARALAVKPKFIIADEAVSALDVSTKRQILELLDQLQKEHKLTYLFITHDLGIVHRIADRIAVMRSGVLVEEGKTIDILESPNHQYTKDLLSAVPNLNPRMRRFRTPPIAIS